MVVQQSGESRLHYLLRVAIEFCSKHDAGTVDYDETTCDGNCLADELSIELDTLEELEALAGNQELARAAVGN